MWVIRWPIGIIWSTIENSRDINRIQSPTTQDALYLLCDTFQLWVSPEMHADTQEHLATMNNFTILVIQNIIKQWYCNKLAYLSRTIECRKSAVWSGIQIQPILSNNNPSWMCQWINYKIGVHFNDSSIAWVMIIFLILSRSLATVHSGTAKTKLYYLNCFPEISNN